MDYAAIKSIDSMSHEERKAVLSELSKGLAHPARIEIITMLAAAEKQADRCVCGDIVNALPLAQSSVSQHLKVLHLTGWVQRKMEGVQVSYCLREEVIEFYRELVHKTLSLGK